MTAGRRGGRSFSRAIYDIAQVLESVDASPDRLRRALELLRWVVPCDECALLDAQPAEHWILVEPEPPATRRAEISAALDRLLAQLVEDRARNPAREAVLEPKGGGTLAVPLVGDGVVIGMLYVHRAAGVYTARDLRSLAVVAGQLAAYLSLVRAHDESEARARELDVARRAAVAANRAKDEFLAVVSHELKDPVAATLAWAHLLAAASGDAAENGHAVAAIERNANVLTRLIDDIQGLAFVASAEMSLDMRAIEPARVLKAAIEGLLSPVRRMSSPIQSPNRSPGRLNFVSEPRVPPVSGVPEADRPLDGIRVLLVDDDFELREAFQWVLERYGATVKAVDSAASALAELERSRPDVLLCDLGMPGENGYDLMRTVAARDAALPAAALTAFGDLADPALARAAGFRIQLGKPIDAAALVAAVADLAGGRTARRAAQASARSDP